RRRRPHRRARRRRHLAAAAQRHPPPVARGRSLARAHPDGQPALAHAPLLRPRTRLLHRGHAGRTSLPRPLARRDEEPRMPLDDGLAAEPYCYLTTTGRVTGRPHTIEIWFGHDGSRPDTIY